MVFQSSELALLLTLCLFWAETQHKKEKAGDTTAGDRERTC